MAVIKAFAALRPKPEYAKLIAAPPYDVLSSDEAREAVKGNPYSFLRVDKPEVDLDTSIDIYDERVYAKAAENLGWLVRNVMTRDDGPRLYIYRLIMDGAPQTGLVACCSVDEYLSGAIKKHELTREDKERDRTRHIEATNANTGPIFLAYRHSDNPAISGIIAEYARDNESAYDFVSDDGITHQVWVIDNADVMSLLTDGFAIVPSLYIADGHHRNASAANVALKRRKNNADPGAEFNYTLSVIFPDTELRILACNRLVKDLNGLSDPELLERIRERFAVTPSATPLKPNKPRVFGMYMNKKWYRLELRENWRIPERQADALDVSVLQNELLTPILGIGDPRADKRLDFVGGIRGLRELEERVELGEMAAAFSMYPTSMNQLTSIADAGEIMPPKSTWFEPKLRSGLFTHWLE
ncbi:MAG: DUF1015 family protein [Clostridiales bacterium]|jgi:uncharacterized protein (DUF1015 family)|nr:DUF1015 family protein [Clostridiales bacterium]